MKFQGSTHKQHWLFSKQTLEDTRQRLNQDAVDKIRRCASEEPESDAKRKQTGLIADSPAITPDEEKRLLKYYQSQIPETCKALKLAKKVETTALVYLKRFYTQFSCMDYDPQRIMLTCIYLACKIEEWYTSADDICRRFGHPDGTQVLRTEVVLLQGLKFDLVIHSPYRGLDGFWADIEACRREGPSAGLDEAIVNAAPDVILKAQGAAHASCDALMLSDAPLTHPPGQVALAALRSGFKRYSLRLPKFMARVADRAAQAATEHAAGTTHELAAAPGIVPPADPLTALHRALDEIDQLGMAGAEKVQMADATAIDRRLKVWRNPLLDPNSAASKKAAAANDLDKASKRDAKLRMRREANLAREAALLGGTPPPPATDTQPAA